MLVDKISPFRIRPKLDLKITQDAIYASSLFIMNLRM